MNPRLIAISGTLKGTIFDLAEDEILIGREGSNPICLNDLSVSRRHCLIKCERAQTQNKISEVEPQAGEVNSESSRPESKGHAVNPGRTSKSGLNERNSQAVKLCTTTEVPA